MKVALLELRRFKVMDIEGKILEKQSVKYQYLAAVVGNFI